MATTNGLSTPLSLVRFLNVLKTIPNKDSTTKETVGTGNGVQTTFWLDNLGVIEGTYTLYYGSAETTTTTLTETTHYTLDLDNSKIVLTSAGVTLLSTNNMYAVYKYNSLELLNADLLEALNSAENKLLSRTDQTFTNSTLLAYREISNEGIKGHDNPYQKLFDLYYSPIVKIHTTVNGAYTTGGTSITLTDSSLFPANGTIYIGGNKVTYTANAANVLTVPAATPSIATGATVRAEVIEISMEPEGSATDYAVLDPDTEYEIDYNHGRIKILANAYWGEISAEDRIYPSNYLIRTTYMQAWHEPDKNPEIPDEIEWVVNAMAARKLMGAVVAKATAAGLNDFNPSLMEVDKEAIQEVLNEYSNLNVGTSMYNKQSLS